MVPVVDSLITPTDILMEVIEQYADHKVYLYKTAKAKNSQDYKRCLEMTNKKREVILKVLQEYFIENKQKPIFKKP